MKNKVLLPVFYLPPISWFSALENAEEIELEQYENFIKQTYRNRMCIYGANGKLSLIIPIKHSGSKVLKDIKMSFAEDWVSHHWKSIKSAYQNTPYFEYYEHKIKSIYNYKTDSLIDFNCNAINVLLKIIKSDKKFSLSSEYNKVVDYEDYRDLFSTKSETSFEMIDYYQAFSDKHGFLKDLSILDLICNIGPESLTYIKNIKFE